MKDIEKGDTIRISGLDDAEPVDITVKDVIENDDGTVTIIPEPA